MDYFSAFDNSSNFTNDILISPLKDQTQQQKSYNVVDEHGFHLGLTDSDYHSIHDEGLFNMTEIDDHFDDYSNTYHEDELTYGLSNY